MTINEKMLKKILENDLTVMEESIKEWKKYFDDLEGEIEINGDEWKINDDYINEGRYEEFLHHRDYIKKLINLITDDKKISITSNKKRQGVTQ
jgi:hypothetical protein